MTFQQKLEALEQKAIKARACGSVPGTQLTRALHPEGGVEWCLAIGGLMQIKRFFCGENIEEIVNHADRWLDEVIKKQEAMVP